MSDIKVNGNTYSGVTSVKLMKADGSGYAEYKEGAAAADPLIDKLIANDGTSLGDYIREDAEPCLEWLTGYTVGTVSFPYATKVKGGCDRVTAENLLLPNVETMAATSSGNGGWRSYGFNNCKISGTLDLSKLATVMNSATTFNSVQIGTLKLGSYMPQKQFAQNAVCTNVVWYGFVAPDDTSGLWAYLNAMTITNLYVPAAQKAAVQAKIDDGTMTKITNLYSIDEWEG